MKKMVSSVMLVLILSSMFVFCPKFLGLQEAYASPHVDITASVAYAMWTNGSFPDLIFLDVRDQNEGWYNGAAGYGQGHIYGAIWIPWSGGQLASRLGELAGYKNTDIIVYCKSGGRSDLAANLLDADGFTKVYDMILGLGTWVNAGYPVVNKTELTIGVVGSGATDPVLGVHAYDKGTVVSVDALPTTGWMLDHWLLDLVDVGDTDPYSVTMDGNHVLTAVFVEVPPVQWKLTIVSAHDSPTPGVGDHLYTDGSSVVCNVTSPVIDGGISCTCTGWIGTGSVPASGSGVSIVFIITEESTITWNWQSQEPPTIESCDCTGLQIDLFNLEETVYVTGRGYARSQTYSIYILCDETLSDGMTIPERVQGTATTVSSDSSGNINLIAVWNEPLTPGKYDIVVDVNGNGRYDNGVDALCNNKITATAGFFVIPEYLFGTISGLVGCLAAFGVFRIYKRRR